MHYDNFLGSPSKFTSWCLVITEINKQYLLETRSLWKVGVLNKLNKLWQMQKIIKSVSLCSIAIRCSLEEKQGRQQGESTEVLRQLGVQGWGASWSVVVIMWEDRIFSQIRKEEGEATVMEICCTNTFPCNACAYPSLMSLNRKNQIESTLPGQLQQQI